MVTIDWHLDLSQPWSMPSPSVSAIPNSDLELMGRGLYYLYLHIFESIFASLFINIYLLFSS